MRRIFLQIILSVLCLSAQAQKVSNIRAEQRGQEIVVFYSLETTAPCEVSLLLSQDNGVTWSAPLRNVSGDVGNIVSSGDKQIIWKLLGQYDQFIGDKIKFKVSAIALVKFGNKIWMSKNLNVSYFANGDEIKMVDNFKDWIACFESRTPAWCFVNFDSKTEEKYGKLYNGFAVLDPRGLAPIGYKIPSVQDYKDVALYYGFVSEGKDLYDGFGNGASKFKPKFSYSGGISVSISWNYTTKTIDDPEMSYFFGEGSITRVWTRSFESGEFGDWLYWFGLNEDIDDVLFATDRLAHGFPVRCFR